MRANIYLIKNNPLFTYKFMCPIDRRMGYFNEGDPVFFGVIKTWGTDVKPLEVKVDLKNMVLKAS